MGRVPCCEKMGMKKGPWTPQEDQILVSFIQQFGHSNWRALPKQAGLLRCGKSCRLRWINYLRPDIKRGNFTVEEQQTIINLHHILGNRWSAIAAKLPGRTDNEVKNYWHTHIKKRLLKQNCSTPITSSSSSTNINTSKDEMIFNNAECVNYSIHQRKEQYCNLLLQQEPSSNLQDLTATVEPIDGFTNVNDFWCSLFLKAAGNSSELNGD